ncbi:MAG: T9SS type A sorting domain-containing protein [Bacteroidetes bacterium]|nr:T9SS type A sorting domain-containing protein [Bacteroidota bacterium]
MIKNILIAGALSGVLALPGKAQITVTSANLPSANDTIRYSNCSPSSVTYSVTGANTYWDFSTLSMTSQGLYKYVPASATPYAFYFLGPGKYGLKIADSIGTGTYTFKNVYNFYKKNTSVFETEGIGFQYSGIPLAATYSNPDEIYVLPLHYLNHDSTTYKFTVQLSTTIYYSQLGYRITDVDGWGYIKTPYDSVPCLRLVSTTYGKDSINYSGFGFNYPDIQRSYKWVTTSEKIPVLELDGTYNNNTFVPTQARYRDVYRSTTGIQPLGEKPAEWTLYPNPTAHFIQLMGISTPCEIILRNTLGNEIWKGYSHTIDISSLPNGMYWLQIGSSTKKIIVQH